MKRVKDDILTFEYEKPACNLPNRRRIRDIFFINRKGRAK